MAGAREWPLDEQWCRWLESLASVHGKERDQRYYTSAVDGSRMAALPKIRVGSEQHRYRSLEYCMGLLVFEGLACLGYRM